MGIRINYTMLGLFVVILGIGLLYAIYWFTADKDPRNYLQYAVYVGESVAGLSEGSSVKYNGVDVGFVKSIKINKKNYQEIELLLNIANDTPVTQNTYATIITQGITGIAFVGLKTTAPHGAFIKAKQGEAYPVIKSNASFFVELDDAVSQVTNNFKSLVTKIEKLLDDENQKSLKDILKNMNNITMTISAKSDSINKSLSYLESTLGKLDNIVTTFPELSKKLNKALDGFENITTSISKSSLQFNNTLLSTQQLVSNVSQQIVPEMHKSLAHLDDLLIDVNNIARDLKTDPSVLIRGKAVTQLGPGEHK